ncbi:unnamed protein product, partial [Prorocentrum cordatum]
GGPPPPPLCGGGCGKQAHQKMRESSQQVHDVVTVAPAAEPARPLGTRASAAPAASQGRAGPRMLGRSVHCVAKHASIVSRAEARSPRRRISAASAALVCPS